MSERLSRDVLSKRPELVTLHCGLNDVWHGEKGVPLEDFKKHVTSIIDRCYEIGAKVMLVTTTVITEDLGNIFNQNLAPYNDFLRGVANERGCLLADVNAKMIEQIRRPTIPRLAEGHLFTINEVQMNPHGHMLIAEVVLRACGVRDDEMELIRLNWSNIPAAVDIKGRCAATISEYQRLLIIAEDRGVTYYDLINSFLREAVATVLRPADQKPGVSG